MFRCVRSVSPWGILSRRPRSGGYSPRKFPSGGKRRFSFGHVGERIIFPHGENWSRPVALPCRKGSRFFGRCAPSEQVLSFPFVHLGEVSLCDRQHLNRANYYDYLQIPFSRRLCVPPTASDGPEETPLPDMAPKRSPLRAARSVARPAQVRPPPGRVLQGQSPKGKAPTGRPAPGRPTQGKPSQGNPHLGGPHGASRTLCRGN